MPAWRTPWITIKCPECDKKIQVDKVDEDYIEESGMNPDFVEGDNWLHDQRQTDHPKYVPDHHIFLSTLIFQDRVKVLKTLGHEMAEIAAEQHGMGYDQAHAEVANPVETDIAQMARGGTMDAKQVEQNKVNKVMGEFGKGGLHSSSGETVTDPKQAAAIAYSEAREKLKSLRSTK